MEKELYTKSILTNRFDNSTHISVMSRHTLEDGATPDERIVENVSYDEWAQEFSPPDKLVGAYYRDEVDWDGYERQYLDHLRSDEVLDKLRLFAERCLNESITIMCVEDTPDKCHRRLLAEELHRIEPRLKIVHR